MASPIELTLNDDKGLGMTCEPPSHHFVHRQHLVEEVVEVRHPLVGQRVRLCCWILVNLHDFRVRWSQWLVSPQDKGRQHVIGLIRLLVADRGLVLIAGEDAHRHQLSARRRFCQCVGRLVEMPRDVIELETIELVLQLADFSAIHSHLGIMVA